VPFSKAFAVLQNFLKKSIVKREFWICYVL